MKHSMSRRNWLQYILSVPAGAWLTRYRAMAAHVKDGTMFKRSEPVTWHCRNCGYLVEGKDAPDICPSCNHPRAYYEELADNYR